MDTRLGHGDIGSLIIAPLRNLKRKIREELKKGEEDERR